MKKILILSILLIMGTLSFGEERKENSYEDRFRIMTSVWTRHPNDNDVYNNKNNLLGVEYFFNEKTSINFAYFENSFYNDSYLLGVTRYMRPFSHESLFFTVTAGVIKGYEKHNVIIDKHTGEEVKKSKFNSNFYKDHIFGASVGVGYDITDRFAVSLNYTGPVIVLLHFKI